jgi:hypothetical protein
VGFSYLGQGIPVPPSGNYMSHAIFIPQNLLIGTAAAIFLYMAKKIIGILILGLLVTAGALYYFRQKTKNENIERSIRPQPKIPKPLYAKVECSNFSRDSFGSKVDIVLSNPSSISYSAIYVTVVAAGKNELTVKLEEIVFTNIKPNSRYSKTIELPHSAVSAVCVLTKFDE